MKIAVTAVRMLTGLIGVTLVLLGILFWSGHALSWVPIHMALGVLLVLSLWLLAGLALFTGVARWLALLLLIWSSIMPILGLAQTALLPGGLHWMIRVLHLLVGIGAVELGHTLARRIASRAEDQRSGDPLRT